MDMRNDFWQTVYGSSVFDQGRPSRIGPTGMGCACVAVIIRRKNHSRSIREHDRAVAVDEGAVVDVVADAFGEGDAFALAA